MSNLEIQLAKLEERLENFLNKLETVEKKMDGFDEHFDKKYVTKSEFSPVKLLAYGFAGLILSGFILGLITKAF